MRSIGETGFRRLAQSAPWRFSRLHFTWHPADPGFETVEAWLTRPGHLVVRTADGARHTVEGLPYSVGGFVLEGGRRSTSPVALVPPQSIAPELDEDGLVLQRPTDPDIGYDDPMWQTYTWVAMLDPVELADGTLLDDLVDEPREGRRTWWATVTADDGAYEPRCGCCPLLWGAVSERAEAAAGGPTWAAGHPDVEYPPAWRIGLDHGTGIVVSAEPVGGSRPEVGFGVTIHEVG